MSRQPLCGLFLCVREKEVAVLTRFGKFERYETPGLALVPVCLGMSVAGMMSMRVRQLDVQVETKTRDNVFVTLVVSVQYHVQESKTFTAFFKLSDPSSQITAFVCDVVRSTVPKLPLDELFASKEEIARAVGTELAKTMDTFGYTIKMALVTDIQPAHNVKEAMNEINAAQRMRMAAVETAEAQKIMAVKEAEAQAESKYLAGLGVARQRKAISDGLKESVLSFTGNVHGATAREVMDLVLVTQYFDTLKDLGEHSGSSTIFLPHMCSVSDVAAQLRASGTKPSAPFIAPVPTQSLL